ncbi:hypothetical protein TNCV_3455881 [Trichonephila clavipes]|nr:hypothetical protein TNCV_3455881 [Trichonephila clavipes]
MRNIAATVGVGKSSVSWILISKRILGRCLQKERANVVAIIELLRPHQHVLAKNIAESIYLTSRRKSIAINNKHLQSTRKQSFEWNSRSKKETPPRRALRGDPFKPLLTNEVYFDDNDEMTIPSVKDLSGTVESCVPM